MRRLSIIVIAVLIVSGLAYASVAPAVYAASTVTSPYTTPGEYAVTVPAGVTVLHATLVGGKGGGGDYLGATNPSNSVGGYGEAIQANLNVTPGETLYLEVGGNGLNASAIPANTAGGGGANGGGNGHGSFLGAGGGGGASDIRTCSVTAASCTGATDSLHSRLIVAAGGGGGGCCFGSVGSNGGNAGQNGQAGGTYGCAPGVRPGGGGGAGTASAGGAGGTAGSNAVAGSPGTFGTGGAGATFYEAGGGGGGGYYGGGGGGGANGCNSGGGGGGSSYTGGALTVESQTTDTTGQPLIHLTYLTGTSVISSANPSVFGQSVTFTATVTAPDGGVGTPTGTVTFYDGSTSIGTGTVNGSGQATLTTSSLSVGKHTITAHYGGDSNFNASSGSTEQAVTQTVNKASTTTTVTSSANPSVTGQAVSFTATVSVSAPGAGTPTGTVQFSIDGSPFGSPVPLNSSGQATSPSTSTLSVGVHTVSASYSGDANFTGSSGTLSGGQTVQQAPAITSASSATFTVGSPGSFTITATGSPTPSLTESGNLPAGVSFHDNGNGTATLSGTPAPGTGGTYPLILTASNGVGAPATQNFTLTVDQAPAITSASSTTFQVGAPGSFTVTSTGFPTPSLSESGALPAGVSFHDNGNGTASLAGTPGAGSAGVYHLTITASNGVGAPATQSFTLTVVAGSTTTTLTSSANPSSLHGAVTFTATVTSAGGVPTGTVTFQVDGVTVATVPLDSSGHASFTTSTLGVGTHTITAIYSGSSLYPGSSASIRQQVGYTICPIQLPFQGVTSGHIKIKLQLCDASGADLSSPNIVLTVVGVSPNPGVTPPSGTFSFIPLLGGTNGGYQYSVDATW